MDRVVSSYLPTIKSLAHARERQTRTDSLQQQRIMLIAMANTPGQKDLPFAEKEVDNLQTLLPSTIEISVKKGPTKQEVCYHLYEVIRSSISRVTVSHHQMIHPKAHSCLLIGKQRR